ncbi:MAG: penicillin-binding protein activator [Deltaproteobacteria bacterium]|nr:penicillin-binding protein activator [Deltaproteobacteria bacterium]
MKKRWLMAILCVPFLSGCPTEVAKPIASPVVQQSDSPEAESLFKEAVALFDVKDFEQADEKFALFESEFPTDPLRDQVSIYRGRIFLERGQLADATTRFLHVYNKSDDTPMHPYASMYLGVTAYQSGQFESVVTYLHPIAGRFEDSADNITVLNTLWRAYAELNNLEQQILCIESLIAAQPDADLAQEALDAVRHGVSGQTEAVLKKMRAKLESKGTVWTLVSARIAEIQLQNEQYDAATETTTDIQESGQSNAAMVTALIEAVESRNRADMRTIGCLLPLTGKMRLVGQEVSRGVSLAAGRSPINDGLAPMNIVMRDTAAWKKTPEELVEELVTTHHVSAIIGPMDAHLSASVAKKAQQMGVPIISLSADDAVSKTGSYVFRRFVSNRREVEALVDKARRTAELSGKSLLGLRCASLYPANGYGELMNRILKQTLQAEGVDMVSVSFQPDITDFVKVASNLAREDFSLLFLPMTSSQLALAAPALASAGIWSVASDDRADAKVAQYLIPSAGYSESLLPRAGRYLQRAAFVVRFDADASTESRAFSQNFYNAYKVMPSAFAAYGYDAVLLLSQAVDAGVVGRSELRSWLDEVVEAPQLVLPFEGFDEQGEADALPAVVVLSGTELIRE